jgi:ketosteroid isomerase-like protein
MKRVWFPTLLLCLASLTLLGQKKDEDAIARAVRQLNQAMIDGNQIALEQLTASQLTYGHSSGLIEDKNAYITAIIDGTSGFTSIDLTEQTISISGDVALVRHKFTAGTDNKGQQPGTVKLTVLQVWQKQKGKWLLLARQAAKLQ